MQSTQSNPPSIPLLAQMRALCGAPILPDCSAAAAVGSIMQRRPDVSTDHIHSACIELVAQIQAAGYRAAIEVSEDEAFYCEINWSIPVGSYFGEQTANLLAIVGVTYNGWYTSVRTHLGGEVQDTLRLDVVTLDETTLQRWLSLWLEMGMSHHAHLNHSEDEDQALSH